MKKIETALKIAQNIVYAMEEEEMQNIKHHYNPRCRKPNFAYLGYLIGCFSECIEEPALTSDEVEQLVRSMWEKNF